MCSGWKFVGLAALYFTLVYNFLLLIVTVTFALRCYDDCDAVQPGEFPADCYATSALYTIYVPTVLAAPFIVLTDRSSIHYLQWWLILHAVLTCCSYFSYICYRSFYTLGSSMINIFGMGGLILTFNIVAYHLFRIRRTPAVYTNQNPAESNA